VYRKRIGVVMNPPMLISLSLFIAVLAGEISNLLFKSLELREASLYDLSSLSYIFGLSIGCFILAWVFVKPSRFNFYQVKTL